MSGLSPYFCRILKTQRDRNKKAIKFHEKYPAYFMHWKVSLDSSYLNPMIIYRMVIVEGRGTMARLSSLGANCSLVDTKV